MMMVKRRRKRGTMMMMMIVGVCDGVRKMTMTDDIAAMTYTGDDVK
jgi:hypothetical protein